MLLLLPEISEKEKTTKEKDIPLTEPIFKHDDVDEEARKQQK